MQGHARGVFAGLKLEARLHAGLTARWERASCNAAALGLGHGRACTQVCIQKHIHARLISYVPLSIPNEILEL